MPRNNRSHLTLTLVILTFLLEVCVGSKILFYNGLAPQTHLTIFEPLAQRLAKEGHHVTIFDCSSSPPEGHISMKYFCPKIFKIVENLEENEALRRLRARLVSNFLQLTDTWDELVEICQEIYASADFMEWTGSSTFDLVVVNSFHRECGMPLSHLFGAKQILFTPSTFFYGDQDVFGLPTEASFVLPMAVEIPFFVPQALLYEYNSLLWYFWRRWKLQPRFDEIVQKELEVKMVKGGSLGKFPPIAELERRTSLFFVNQDFVTADFARALPPFVIPVGGIHCHGARKILDKTVLDAIENSDGFMVINFENFLQKSEELELESTFFENFENFPHTQFFWTWQPQNLSKIFPKNVLLVHKMTPFDQQDLLGHPKCRGLISHGGMLSYQQGIHHAVPQIILPRGGDEIQNAKMVEQLGIGIHLELGNLTKSSVQKAIWELLDNETYSMAVKNLSILFKDRPQSPLDSAVYWTNFVLRHDDLQLAHLKSPAMSQYWWQRRLLHIWILMLLLLILAIGVRLLVFYFAMKLFRKGRRYFSKNSNETKGGPGGGGGGKEKSH